VYSLSRVLKQWPDSAPRATPPIERSHAPPASSSSSGDAATCGVRSARAANEHAAGGHEAGRTLSGGRRVEARPGALALARRLAP